MDLIDGIPVYDVKPYLPYAEAPAGAAGGFAGDEPPRLPVEVAAAAAVAFGDLPARAQALVREALSLDPRPAAGRDEPGHVYGATLGGCDIRFTIADAICRVVGIA